ncbi:class I SAM-dependent DNA methyltransferase [Streptomyces alboflavus]|uniref:class I SAM-dependent DNA methyltransferase n=1 Tax=Streptomyces alboflavus TaxID=67267 RepID=UPI00367C9AD3
MAESRTILDKSHEFDGDASRLDSYYDDWASTYDQDAHNLGYQGPHVMADLFARAVAKHLPGQEAVSVLDAGCGTGLVGPLLVARGATALDGFDLNHSMVTEASRTGAYRILASGVNLDGGLREFAADAFDVTVCLGVFTTGHVRPSSVEGLLRVTRPGGLVLMTTSSRYLADTRFTAHLEALAADGHVQVLDCLPDHTYLGHQQAHYWTLQLPDRPR